MYYIDIGIAKKQHEVCFLDEIGNVPDGNSFNILNTASGLDKYGLSPASSLVGMEATGHYWLVSTLG